VEELLKQILFEIKGLKDGQAAMQTDIIVMRADIKDLKDSQAAIHAEIKNLKESDAAILDMLEKTYRKVETVEDNQDRMSESTRYLMRQGVQHEEDIKRIRKAL
jgi:septation ring formation regulator EzrA